MVNPTPTEDKRQNSRLRSATEIVVQKELLGENIPALLLDYNWYGAGLEIETSIYEGDILHITVPRPEAPNALETKKAKVVWTQKHATDPKKTICGVYFLMEKPLTQ